MEDVFTDDKTRFSDGEVLILSLLIELGKRIYSGDDGFDELSLKRWEALENAIAEGEHGDALGEHLRAAHGYRPEVKEEVFDILDMWDSLEIAYESLPPKTRESVDSRLGEYSDLYVSFGGYDHHHVPGEEGYLGYTQYILDRGRFQRFEGRELGRQVGARLPRYREMLRKYKAYAGAETKTGVQVFDWDVVHGRRAEVPEEDYKRYEDILVDIFSTAER